MGLQDREYMHERHRAQAKRQPGIRPAASKHGNKSSGLGKSILFFVITLSVGTYITHKISPNKAPINWSNLLPFSAKEIPMPATGELTLYQRGHSASAVASFSVVATSPGFKKTSHLVKLVDAATGEPVLSVFVRSGETAAIKIPLGVYKANIASGEKWYGETKLFGNGTVVQQGNSTLTFYSQGNSIMGHTLTLAGTIDGNFPTRQLPADAF